MEVPVEILENYHREVSTIMLDREIQLQQMMKLQLISLNLFIEYKNELHFLRDCRMALWRDHP